jgi:hypothetical protein
MGEALHEILRRYDDDSIMPLAGRVHRRAEAKSKSTRGSSLIEAVDFGGHDEVTFGEAVNLVSPESDFSFAPSQQNVGVVALLFGDCANAIDEIESLFEVGELELAVKMMLVGDGPLWDASVDFLQFLAFERGNASLARNALFVGEFGHGESGPN